MSADGDLMPAKSGRCGECRLGLGIHDSTDPQCDFYVPTFDPTIYPSIADLSLGDIPVKSTEAHELCERMRLDSEAAAERPPYTKRFMPAIQADMAGSDTAGERPISLGNECVGFGGSLSSPAPAGIVQEPEGRIMGVDHGPFMTLGSSSAPEDERELPTYPPMATCGCCITMDAIDFRDWLAAHDAALVASTRAQVAGEVVEMCRQESKKASLRELSDRNAYLRRTVWDRAERFARAAAEGGGQ